MSMAMLHQADASTMCFLNIRNVKIRCHEERISDITLFLSVLYRLCTDCTLDYGVLGKVRLENPTLFEKLFLRKKK